MWNCPFYVEFNIHFLLQGLNLKKDDDGSILATKLTKNDIIVKGYKDPAAHCISSDVIESMGRLKDLPLKVCIDIK